MIDLRVDLILDDEYQAQGLTLSADGHTVITVPRGFVTDFSSIPPFARVLYRFDSVDLAGCCHDRAYYVGVPRDVADEIWRLVAMSGERAVGRWRARLGWLALRLGGWPAYRDHANRRRQRTSKPSEPGAPKIAA